MRVLAGNDILVDEDLAVPRRHGRDDVLQDGSALLVRPVVQDRVHVIGACAFDGLGREEVVGHGFDGSVQLGFRVVDDGGLVLQDQAAWQVGVLALELFEIVAEAAADVDEQHGVFGIGVEAFGEKFLDGVEVGIHPAWTALTVAGHVMVEGGKDFRVGLQPAEEVEWCRVTILKGPVQRILGIVEAVLGEVFGEFCERGPHAVKAR